MIKKLTLAELNRVNVAEFKAKTKNTICLVLDNIRSGHNVGSFFRMADAFAINKIIITGISAVPPHREINKTAIGSTLSVDWQYVDDICKGIETLKSENYDIVGVEQTNESIPLQEWTPPATKNIALVFGNEVEGLSAQVLPLLDYAIEIPQFGTKHSLNVSVCAGIVIWQAMKSRIT